MAQITRLGFFRHFRSETSSFVVRFTKGKVVQTGRGLSFFFQPHDSSFAELPADDREMAIAFHGRSADFQDVAVQGVLTYRVADPRTLAERVDFTIDLATGKLLAQPLEKLELLFSQLAEQHARAWLARTPLQEVLAVGAERRDGDGGHRLGALHQRRAGPQARPPAPVRPDPGVLRAGALPERRHGHAGGRRHREGG